MKGEGLRQSSPRPPVDFQGSYRQHSCQSPKQNVLTYITTNGTKLGCLVVYYFTPSKLLDLYEGVTIIGEGL
mgnify:CR=1 FL=1